MNTTQHNLSKFFFLHMKFWLVLSIVIFSFDMSAKESYPDEVMRLEQAVQDTLIISRTAGTRSIQIIEDQRIKLWVGKKTVIGKFVEIKNDSVSIKTFDGKVKYDVASIRKIKLYGEGARRLIGGGFQIWGGAIIVAGAIVPFTLGPAGLLISVPSWAVGYGIYRLGSLIAGARKFNLKTKWNIDKSPA